MNERAPARRDSFLANGFVVARGILDPAALHSVNGEIAELFAIQLRRLHLPVDPGGSREAFRANAVRLLRADVPAYIATARLTQMLPSVNQLVTCERLLHLARELGLQFPVIAIRAVIHFMAEELKVPNGYHKEPPHQDWRILQGSLDSIVLWVPTVPVPATSHPLEVVAKSHLLGLLNTIDDTITISDPRITNESYVAVPVELGDVVAFSSFLVHRTGDQDDGLVRIALSCRFNNAAEQSYVQHGYPAADKYTFRSDLIIEGFPTRADLASIFPGAAAGE